MAIHHRLIALTAIAFVLVAPVAGAGRLQERGGFVVNDSGTAGDADLNDHECATKQGGCTLAAALEQASWDKYGGVEISFKLPGSDPYIAGSYTIPSNSVVDGSSQPGYGSTPIVGIQRLVVASDTVVKDMAIYPQYGTGGEAGILIVGDRTTLTGSYVGLNHDGEIGGPDQKHNDGVFVGGHDDVIGGTTEAARNVIDGWAQGIVVLHAAGTRIEGNYIGVDPDGTAALGNVEGIAVEGSKNVTIGGATASARNVISGSKATDISTFGAQGSGISITGQATNGVKILGNYIGTNAEGTAALANTTDGIDVETGIDIQIGSAHNGMQCSAPCNLISGNGVGVSTTAPGDPKRYGDNVVIAGNFIGSDVAGKKPVPNTDAGIYAAGSAVLIGTERRRTEACTAGCNLISGNAGDGIRAAGAGSRDQVAGNYVGVDISGEKALANRAAGMRLLGAGWLVGDRRTDPRDGCKGACNLVSGNDGDGFVVAGSVVQSELDVTGSVIGLDKGGRPRPGLGNHGDGVKIVGKGARIGWSRGGAGNLIAASGKDGVELVNAEDVEIDGNWIGVDAAGKPAGNKRYGVYVHGSRADAAVGDVVGGIHKTDIRSSCTGSCNVISSNEAGGILIWGVGGVNVQGNYVGVTPNGEAKSPNGHFGVKISTVGPHAGDGIFQTVNNVVGGRRDGASLGDAANLISGNDGPGVIVEDDPAQGGLSPDVKGNEVLGNLIGTDRTGEEPLGNDFGVWLLWAFGARVGAPDAGNVISGNASTGVVVRGSSNRVQNNVAGLDRKGQKKLSNGGGQIAIAFGQHNVVTHNVVLAGSDAVVESPAASENTKAPNTERAG